MRRRTWLVIGAVVVAAAAVTGALLATSGSSHPSPTTGNVAVGTAKVLRGELSATISVAGTLTYRAQPDGSPYDIVNQTRGILTELPAPGQVIRQGHVLYRVSGKPVVLLRGTTPTYRTLSPGTRGTDVAALNADLVALGYATAAQLDPTSARFNSATTAAVKKLQAAARIPATGTLSLGEALFEPAALRVTALPVSVGGSIQPGQSVMQATSTARQVQIALDASQQSDVAVGDTVTITLPDNRTIPGAVTSVASVATCPSDSQSGESSSSSASTATDTCSGANAATSSPTIAVTVTPVDGAAASRWDQAPVQVGITTARIRHALSVPVAALLAQTGGGYVVEVVGVGAGRHLEPVTLGLFDDADGLVQVTHTALTAGQDVVVPTP